MKNNLAKVWKRFFEKEKSVEEYKFDLILRSGTEQFKRILSSNLPIPITLL